MNRLRASRLATWIAFIVISLAALAPTVSRALATRGDASSAWLEICTTSGPRWVSPLNGELASDGPAPGESAPAPLSLDHCPFCLTGADRTSLPAPTATPTILAPGRPVTPVAGPPLPCHAAIIQAARPRGPPLLLASHRSS